MSRYLQILATQRPFVVTVDESKRSVFSCNFTAMAASLVEQWEREIVQILIDNSLADFGVDTFIAPFSVLPIGDGPFCHVLDTGGTAPLEAHTGEKYDNLSIQITVRARDFELGRARAIAIYELLDGIRNLTVTVDEGEFDPAAVPGVTHFQTPTTLPASGNITQLLDSSTPVNNFNQTTPSFQGVAGTGELISVSHNIMDGVDDYYTAGDTGSLSGSSLTIVMLAKQPILIHTQILLAQWRWQTDGGFALGTLNGVVDELIFFVAEAPTSSGLNFVKTTNADMGALFNVITVQFNAGVVTYEINDVVPDTAINGSIPTSLLDSGGDLEIGRWDGLGRYYNGFAGNGYWIGPVIPSPTDLQGIQDFFAAFIP